MIIRPGEMPEEGQEPRPLILKRVINADEHGSKLSVTWVRIWGHHERVVNQSSDRAYYIISGSGWFQVGDTGESENVGAGEMVFIPAGTPYEFEGEMTYIVMNGPAFVAGSDVALPSVMGKP
jgi:mannose-6-phosphate isomerase-like protein (cupin superfamily)